MSATGSAREARKAAASSSVDSDSPYSAFSVVRLMGIGT